MSEQTSMTANDARELISRLETNIQQVIRGKDDAIRLSLIGLLAGGHLLFEDVPGVGKTTLAHCLARSVSLSFQRVQCTSDMMPADILGVVVYDQKSHSFTLHEGPIFANIVVIDEINRTTPKTQSALLEAMSQAQVSIERTTYELPKPFMVMATQNPVESHGTFPLPNSQLDRFLMRLHLGYPEPEYEREILASPRGENDLTQVKPLISGEDLLRMQRGVREVKAEDSIVDYIQRLVQATRHTDTIEHGISTRGALALRNCAMAHAYYNGRDYCVPEDVKTVAVPVLAHRITQIAGFQDLGGGVGQGNALIEALVEQIAVPI